MSCSLKGDKNPMYRNAKKTASCKVCNKEFQYYPSSSSGMYCCRKCTYQCPEWLVKQRETKIGRTHTPEAKKRMSIARKGVKHHEEWRKNQGLAVSRRYDRIGRKHEGMMRIRLSKRYQEWRKEVFERDGYRCTKCYDARGGNLEAHHDIPLSVLYREKEMGNDVDLYDTSNGITLCTDCHKKTDSYATHTSIEMKMINALKKFWEQRGKQGDFELFYRTKMESLIERLKEQI
jgi:5-methylcytosine-specific restriction endonuclease McrA